MMEVTSPVHGKGTLICVRDIVVLKGRGRKELGDVMELMESIKKNGLIHPLTVAMAEDGSGKYELVAGERRFRALLMAGFSHVPCMLRDELSDLERKELELEENLTRRALDWSEEAELMLQLEDIKRQVHGSAMSGVEGGGEGWTQAKTAELVGKSRPTVNAQINMAKILRDRPDLKDKLCMLPLSAAAKVSKQILETERVGRLIKAGKLQAKAELRLGSCIDLLPSIAESSVDFVLTDPPFGITAIEEQEGEANASEQYKSQLLHTDNLSEVEVRKLMATTIPLLYRVLKPSSRLAMFICFDLYEFLWQEMTKVGFDVCRTPLIWYKGRTTTPGRGYMPMSCSEPLLLATKGVHTTKRLHESLRTVIECSPETDKIHPFQKPLPLLTLLIKACTGLGEVVLDPFAGSASTLIASKACGRQGVGMEVDEERWTQGQGRLCQGLAKADCWKEV